MDNPKVLMALRRYFLKTHWRMPTPVKGVVGLPLSQLSSRSVQSAEDEDTVDMYILDGRFQFEGHPKYTNWYTYIITSDHYKGISLDIPTGKLTKISDIPALVNSTIKTKQGLLLNVGECYALLMKHPDYTHTPKVLPDVLPGETGLEYGYTELSDGGSPDELIIVVPTELISDSIEDPEGLSIDILATGVVNPLHIEYSDQDTLEAAMSSITASSIIVNGEFFDVPPNTITTNDRESYRVIDETVCDKVTIQLDSNATFLDSRGTINYILHIPKTLNPDNNCINPRLCNIFLVDALQESRPGLNLNNYDVDPQPFEYGDTKHPRYPIASLTHNDFCVQKSVIDHYATILNSSVMEIVIYIPRELSGGPVVLENNLLRKLYELTDTEIVDFIKGDIRHPEYSFWSGKSLLDSRFSRLLESPSYRTISTMFNISDFIEMLGYRYTIHALSEPLTEIITPNNLIACPPMLTDGAELLIHNEDGSLLDTSLYSYDISNGLVTLTYFYGVENGSKLRVEFLPEDKGDIILVLPENERDVLRTMEDYLLFKLDTSGNTTWIDVSADAKQYIQHVTINDLNYIRFKPGYQNDTFSIQFADNRLDIEMPVATSKKYMKFTSGNENRISILGWNTTDATYCIECRIPTTYAQFHKGALVGGSNEDYESIHISSLNPINASEVGTWIVYKGARIFNQTPLIVNVTAYKGQWIKVFFVVGNGLSPKFYISPEPDVAYSSNGPNPLASTKSSLVGAYSAITFGIPTRYHSEVDIAEVKYWSRALSDAERHATFAGNFVGYPIRITESIIPTTSIIADPNEFHAEEITSTFGETGPIKVPLHKMPTNIFANDASMLTLEREMFPEQYHGYIVATSLDGYMEPIEEVRWPNDGFELTDPIGSNTIPYYANNFSFVKLNELTGRAYNLGLFLNKDRMLTGTYLHSYYFMHYQRALYGVTDVHASLEYGAGVAAQYGDRYITGPVNRLSISPGMYIHPDGYIIGLCYKTIAISEWDNDADTLTKLAEYNFYERHEHSYKPSITPILNTNSFIFNTGFANTHNGNFLYIYSYNKELNVITHEANVVSTLGVYDANIQEHTQLDELGDIILYVRKTRATEEDPWDYHFGIFDPSDLKVKYVFDLNHTVGNFVFSGGLLHIVSDVIETTTITRYRIHRDAPADFIGMLDTNFSARSTRLFGLGMNMLFTAGPYARPGLPDVAYANIIRITADGYETSVLHIPAFRYGVVGIDTYRVGPNDARIAISHVSQRIIYYDVHWDDDDALKISNRAMLLSNTPHPECMDTCGTNIAPGENLFYSPADALRNIGYNIYGVTISYATGTTFDGSRVSTLLTQQNIQNLTIDEIIENDPLKDTASILDRNYLNHLVDEVIINNSRTIDLDFGADGINEVFIPLSDADRDQWGRIKLDFNVQPDDMKRVAKLKFAFTNTQSTYIDRMASPISYSTDNCYSAVYLGDVRLMHGIDYVFNDVVVDTNLYPAIEFIEGGAFDRMSTELLKMHFVRKYLSTNILNTYVDDILQDQPVVTDPPIVLQAITGGIARSVGGFVTSGFEPEYALSVAGSFKTGGSVGASVYWEVVYADEEVVEYIYIEAPTTGSSQNVYVEVYDRHSVLQAVIHIPEFYSPVASPQGQTFEKFYVPDENGNPTGRFFEKVKASRIRVINRDLPLNANSLLIKNFVAYSTNATYVDIGNQLALDMAMRVTDNKVLTPLDTYSAPGLYHENLQISYDLNTYNLVEDSILAGQQDNLSILEKIYTLPNS